METRGIAHSGNVGRTFTLQRRAPAADLAALVENHWIVSWELPEGVEYPSVVLPHPCVHLVVEPHGAFLWGVPTSRFVRTLAGTGWAVGTRFLPGGLAGLTEIDAGSLRGDAIRPELAFGTDGSAFAAAVAGDRLRADATIAAVTALLRARRPEAVDARVMLVREVIAAMREASPGTTVAELAAAHHVTPRSLQRLFAVYIGVSPKWVLRRYRLQEALDRIDRSRPIDWGRFALELGYYDQAHFARDFRTALGVTPGQYAAAGAG